MSSVVPKHAGSEPRRKLLRWLPTLVWLCIQAALSTDAFSAEHTGSILWKIVHFFYSGITAGQFETLHFLVRKTAHFSSYGVLSVFAFFSWRETLPSEERWTFRWSALAFVLATLAGSLDEFHQIFVPSRTPAVRDVLIDASGALFFQILVAAFLRRKSRKANVSGASPSEAVPQ